VRVRLRLKCDDTRRKQISSFGETDEPIEIIVGRHFSRLLAADVCVSAVVMLDTHHVPT